MVQIHPSVQAGTLRQSGFQLEAITIQIYSLGHPNKLKNPGGKYHKNSANRIPPSMPAGPLRQNGCLEALLTVAQWAPPSAICPHYPNPDSYWGGRIVFQHRNVKKNEKL